MKRSTFERVGEPVEPRKSADLREEIGELLRRFGATSEDLSRAFGTRHGLHHTAARAIMELMESAEAGTPMTAGGLGVALDLTPASVTALVDRMVAAGHVRREPDPSDRRRVLLVVEPGAVDLGEEFFHPLAEDLETMMSGYSVPELEVVGRFLGDSIDAVRDHLSRLD